MKIRIKGNSLRIRLSISEVARLVREGLLEEQTSFGRNSLFYALQTIPGEGRLSADFIENKITMYVPASLIKDWPENDLVGIDAIMPLTENDGLHLLLEKDFVCISETSEDQSDNFENPNKTC